LLTISILSTSPFDAYSKNFEGVVVAELCDPPPENMLSNKKTSTIEPKIQY